MRGVVFLGERKLELREFPDPRPGPGEVVLAMKASGMCGSDLHPYRASRRGGATQSLGLGGTGGPHIAGHEPCGIVAERGPGVPEAAAPTEARVMNHHYKGCGHCKHCRAGWAQLCPRGIVVYEALQAEGHPVEPGALGENLTIAGLDWAQVQPEAFFLLGDEVLVQITRFTSPCVSVRTAFLDGAYSRVSEKRHPGWSRVYARVLVPGDIAAGDAVERLSPADVARHLAVGLGG